MCLTKMLNTCRGVGETVSAGLDHGLNRKTKHFGKVLRSWDCSTGLEAIFDIGVVTRVM